MEIKRQIIESKIPPSNKEVWWFNSNTETLNRYVEGKWDTVVSSSSIVSDNSREVIKTTYEEVRELYYTGKMDPNVKYEFYYEFKPSFDTVYNADLKLYLNFDGSLKAEGVGYDEYNTYPFTADFAFDKLYVDSDETYDEPFNIYECFESHTIPHSYYMQNLLDKYGFKYDFISYGPNDAILLIHDVAVYDIEDYNYDDDVSNTYTHIVNKSGTLIKIGSGDYSHPSVYNIDINPKALLYNIQYSDKFHYKLLDGIHEYDATSVLECQASVYGCDYSDYIDWESYIAESISGISYGIIVNSNLNNLDIYINDLPIIVILNNFTIINEE